MDVIRELCKKYTDLTEEEIATIQGMSAVLQPLANLEDADIFIDCPSWDGDAIVVAEAKPSYVPSSYKKTVVGLLARKENEPAVARTFRLGVATKQMKAVTQENGRTIQSVEPIKNTAGDRVIGVLIREQRVDEQRQISERLHFSEQSYEQIANALSHMVGSNNWLTECIDEALLMVDRTGVVAFRNSLARDLYQKLGYVEDLLSYVAIGARSVEDQHHRLTVSGFDVASGMKNPTSGDFSVMLNSVYAAQHPHHFTFAGYEVLTTGNPLAHTILRGAVSKHGNSVQNYHYEDLMRLSRMYHEMDLVNPACIVDANHSNSNKQFKQQIRIVREVMASRQFSSEIKKLVKGVMIESYIEEGCQPISDHQTYGKSITDPCLGWRESEQLIMTIAEMNK